MKASEESMNVADFASQVGFDAQSSQGGGIDIGVASACSALMDGDISDQDWNDLWKDAGSRSVSLETWNAYQVVGDALRGGASLTAATPAATFLANFQDRLQQELVTTNAQPRPDALTAPLSPADRSRTSAANDSVFRWKMLAMAASVSAVMAVSWSVLGTAAGGGETLTGAELASAPALVPAQPVAVAKPDVEVPVVVQTGQGPLIRDARLEALLAEHRQYGGMSALQKPAGFLRNATYDAADR